MSLLLASVAATCCAHAPLPSFGYYAVINEVRIDQPGADSDEYFEIYTPSGATLLEYMTYVVIGDGAGGSGTIEAVIDLSTMSTNADGYLVVAEGTFSLGVADVTTTLNFENGDNVTHILASGFTGSVGDDLDLDDDGVLDVTPWLGYFDAVSMVETLTPDLMAGEEYAYAASLGHAMVGPDGGFVPAHIKLCNEARGGMNIGAFDIGIDDTPGAASIDCAPPTSGFCSPPEPNAYSAGGGLISVTGSFSITLNDNALVASELPNTFGVFVQGSSSMAPVVAAIGGNICVSGSIDRMNEIVVISMNQATLPLDFDDPLRVENDIYMGDTLYYQFFYRDTTFAGGGNYTDGIQVTWEE